MESSPLHYPPSEPFIILQLRKSFCWKEGGEIQTFMVRKKSRATAVTHCHHLYVKKVTN